jgi:hypothetical protein
VLVEFRILYGDSGVFDVGAHVGAGDYGPPYVLVHVVEEDFFGTVVDSGGTLDFSGFKRVQIGHPKISHPQKK